MARPTREEGLYRPEYCDHVVQHMAQGFSLTAAAAKMGFYRELLEGWRRRHKDFDASVKRGQAAQTAWWEERLQSGNQNVVSAIFALKNADPTSWRDKHDIEHGTKDNQPLRIRWIGEGETAKGKRSTDK